MPPVLSVLPSMIHLVSCVLLRRPCRASAQPSTYLCCPTTTKIERHGQLGLATPVVLGSLCSACIRHHFRHSEAENQKKIQTLESWFVLVSKSQEKKNHSELSSCEEGGHGGVEGPVGTLRLDSDSDTFADTEHSPTSREEEGEKAYFWTPFAWRIPPPRRHQQK